jgi:selenocysteine-specific elongation factor
MAKLTQGSPRKHADVFRLPVDRAFSVKGTGTVVTGTVWSGELAPDEVVRILPSDRATRVRRIEQHGHMVARARAGNRAAIALSGTELTDVARGAVIVRDETWQPSALFEAVLALDLETAAALTPRTWLRLHAGASEVGARLTTSNPVGDWNERVLARVTTDSPLVLRGGDRFVLRLPAPLRTIGGGVVVDPYARRRTLPRIDAEDLVSLCISPSARLSYVLRSQASRGLRLADIPVRTGCIPAEVQGLVESTGAYVGAQLLRRKLSNR